MKAQIPPFFLDHRRCFCIRVLGGKRRGPCLVSFVNYRTWIPTSQEWLKLSQIFKSKYFASRSWRHLGKTLPGASIRDEILGNI